MSFGGLGNCPLCWDDPEICNCLQKDIDAYYVKLAEKDKIRQDTEFIIKCKMRTRWVPQFLGMLKAMERLGGLGGSRWVRFFSDGDGDYRPKFEWDETLPTPVSPLKIDSFPISDGFDFYI